MSEHRDWTFIQQTGGLVVAGQDKNPNWLLLRGDVSGLYEFSEKPTLVNSAIALKEVKAKYKENKIQVYVVTTLVSDKYKETEITGVNISGLKSGQYTVQYLNPDKTTIDLKTIEIYKP